MGDDMEGEVEIEEPTESYSFENAMSESKIDKVLSKYFEVSDSEVKQSKLMYESRKNEVKTNAKKSVTQIERLSETIEQELSAKKFLEENNFYNFIGKTNKNNLVFEYKNKQVRISEEGLLL
jgi:L-arabinose isomerase